MSLCSRTVLTSTVSSSLSLPLSGVLLKQYKSIRETISSIVVETLLDPVALRKYFSGKNKKVREMLRVGKHVQGRCLHVGKHVTREMFTCWW